MIELSELAEAEKRLVQQIADVILEIGATGDSNPGRLTALLADLAALRSLIRAKKI